MSYVEKHLSEEGLAAWKDFMTCYEVGYFNEKRVTRYKVDGTEFCMIPEFPQENVGFQFDNFEPRDGDVLIVSFSKTGTTWMREIVRHMMFKDDKVAMEISKDFDPFSIYLEGGRPSKYKAIEELPLKRRYFGTHLPPELINMKKVMEKKVKIIFMLRNPKDALFSLYKFISKFPYPKYRVDGNIISKDWSKFFEEVKDGQHPINMPQGEFYFDFIKRWLPYLKEDYFLTVHYEDLLKQTDCQLKRVASHIGVELNDEEMNRIKEATHISEMFKVSENPGLEQMTRRLFGFIGKGGIGRWKEHFTVAQSEFIDKLYHEKLGDTNIKFTYC